MTASIRDVKSRHVDELMSLAGVLAVGIGKAPDEADAIIVSVRRGEEKTASLVPKRIEGYPVVVRFTDEFRAQ